jgi:hypothetical protein
MACSFKYPDDRLFLQVAPAAEEAMLLLSGVKQAETG